MKYVVIEIQSNETISALVYTYDKLNEAESKYHEILHYAALSEVPLHSATLLSDQGFEIKHESYEHPSES